MTASLRDMHRNGGNGQAGSRPRFTGASPNPLAASTTGISSVGIPILPVRNYIPPNGEEFRWATYVTLPAIGSTIVVVSFIVPKGRNVVINYFANVFVGGGFQEGEGDLVWQLFQDATGFIPGAGYVAGTSKVMPNFDNILASLGAVGNPCKLNGLLASEQQLVALIAYNNPLGPNGGVPPAGQKLGGLLGGYYVQTDLMPATFGF
jgi:hypothetical protein